MRMKATNGDVIWSYLGSFVSLGAGFILLPFILYFLSGEIYGVWTVFLSLGTLVILFDFGLNPTFAKNITYCWSGAKKLSKQGIDAYIEKDGGRPNLSLLREILVSCRVIYALIALIALVCFGIGGTFYINYLVEDMASVVRSECLLAWGVYCFGLIVNLYFGYYDAALRGIGDFTSLNKAKIASKLFQIITSVVLLALGFGILGCAFAFMLSGLAFRLLSRRYFCFSGCSLPGLPSIKDKKAVCAIKDMVEIVWYSAWRDGLVSLSQYLTNQVAVVVCSIYFSLTDTGAYSLAMQLVGAVGSLATVLYYTKLPELESAHIVGDIARVKRTLSISITVSVLSYFACIIIVSVALMPLFTIIKPDSVVSVPVFLGVAFSFFFVKFREYFTSYLSAVNRIIYYRSFLVAAILNVVLEILFVGVFSLGFWGLIGAQFLSVMVYSGWYWPRRVLGELEISLFWVFRNGIRSIRGLV